MRKEKSVGPLIFYNKHLLDYIFDFDGIYKENFIKNIVLQKNILEAAHIFWYKKYENELLSQNNNINLILIYQKEFFNTLELFDNIKIFY